jgi:hypothetical protein
MMKMNKAARCLEEDSSNLPSTDNAQEFGKKCQQLEASTRYGSINEQNKLLVNKTREANGRGEKHA